MITNDDLAVLRAAHLLTAPELAALLHLDARTVRAHLLRPRGSRPPLCPPVTMAGVVYVRAADVLRAVGIDPDTGDVVPTEMPGQLLLRLVGA